MSSIKVDVLIVGAGPAGMVTACLLARQGIKTLVIERNPDFEREFRGEVLQPRFHKAMRDAGLFEAIAKYPHQEISGLHLYVENHLAGSFDTQRLDPRAAPTWWMTQPNLLNALKDYGQSFQDFEIWFDTSIQTIEGEQVEVKSQGQFKEIEAKVIVGSDGRYSTVRKLKKFEYQYEYHDLDIIWFVIPRPKNYEHVFSFFISGHHNFLILPKYPDLLQCGLTLKADEFHALRHRPIEELKEELKQSHSIFFDFAEQLKDYSHFHLLQGIIAYVKDWVQDNVILIGDAAHTCSPIGGIGVAIAVETACVAARVIEQGFQQNNLSSLYLKQIQKQRAPQVKQVHAFQHLAGSRMIRLNPIIKKMIPTVFKLGLATGIVPFAAKQLLTQRKPLF